MVPIGRILNADSRGTAAARGSVRKRSLVKACKHASNGPLLGYAGVSKGDDQANIMRVRALRAAGCRRILEEAASGGCWDWPKLHHLVDFPSAAGGCQRHGDHRAKRR
jgi:hypothetical protein